MRNARKYLSGLLAAAVLAGVLGLAGCAAQYVDPGPQAAKVTLDLQAKVPPGSWPWPGQGWYKTNWDWGLYLVDAAGNLKKLRPDSGEKTVAVETEELVRRASFAAPAGKIQLRLLTSAWYYTWDGRGPNLITLAEYSKDFQLDLSAGGGQTIQARFGF